MRKHIFFLLFIVLMVNSCSNHFNRKVKTESDLYEKALNLYIKNVSNEDSIGKVLELIDKGISYDPNNVNFYYLKTNVFIGQHRYDEAVKAADQGLDISDTLAVLRTVRGILKYELSDTFSAYADFRKAIAIYDDRLLAGAGRNKQFDMANKAFLLMLLGDTAAGKIQFERIKSKYPGFRSADFFYDPGKPFDRDALMRRFLAVPGEESTTEEGVEVIQN